MVPFGDVAVGSHFRYDGELFEKTHALKPTWGVAWSIHFEQRYKEWAFNNNELVQLVDGDC
jgi:hypothetical protein